MSSDTTSPSDENHASGLWLWHGKAPLPPSPPQPASRVQQIPGPNVAALRRAWMGGGARRGSAHVARGHVALDAFGHVSVDQYGCRGARASPIARLCERGHSRSRLSISPHLGSSTRTPRSMRRKCSPRRLTQEQSTDWRKRCRTTHRREPRVKPTHSRAEAHHSSSMECSRLRSRRFRAMAVAELAQRDVSRTDYCARLSTRHVPAGRSFLDPFAPVSAGCSAHLSSRFLKFPRPPSHPGGTIGGKHRSVRT